jgi:hypothetical protein
METRVGAVALTTDTGRGWRRGVWRCACSAATRAVEGPHPERLRKGSRLILAPVVYASRTRSCVTAEHRSTATGEAAELVFGVR